MQEFVLIYETHKELVYNLALHYVQKVEDAEEITQDVFLKVYKQHSNFREESSIKTWIYRITINQCIDFLRQRKRKQQLFSFFIADKSADRQTNWFHPGFALEQQEKVKHIFSKINKLPPQQKTAVLLNKLEGLSIRECAIIMQTTEKAVESLLSRAKSNLKNNL